MKVGDRVFSIYRYWTHREQVHWALLPFISVIRWGVVFYRKLERDRAFIRAAGMAYATLIALVPMLMLLFGGLHAVDLLDVNGNSTEQILQDLLFNTFLADIPEVKAAILPGLSSLDLGAIGLVGVGGLVLVAGRLFMMVERAYNDIFGVPIDRPILYRVLNFYFTLTAFPLILIAGIYSAQQFGLDSGSGRLFPAFLQFSVLLIALKVFPCTPVRWRAALLGAMVSGVLVELGGRIFPLYVYWFATDDPLRVIYGSLGLIPVFLLWLYLLWIFVLLGVEIAHVAQNYTTLLEAEVDQWERRRAIYRAPSAQIAVECALRVGQRYERGEGASELSVLVHESELPSRELMLVLRVLEHGGILVRCDGGWVPSRPIDQIALSEVLNLWSESTRVRPAGRSPLGDAIDEDTRARLSGSLRDGLGRWLMPADEAIGG